MTECKYNKCERCGYANECEIKAVFDKQEKSIFQITEWMYDYKEKLEKAEEIIKAFLNSSDLNIKQKAEEFLGEF